MFSRTVSVSRTFPETRGFQNDPTNKQKKDQDQSSHFIGADVQMSKMHVQTLHLTHAVTNPSPDCKREKQT